MNIVETLAALALRQQIDGADSVAAAQLAPLGEKLDRALEQTLVHTWRAVEIALAGPSWWADCRSQLGPEDEALPVGPLEAFFQTSTVRGLDAVAAPVRLQGRRELRTARQANPPRAAELRPRLAEFGGADGRAAAALRPGFPALANVLETHPALLGEPLAGFFRQAADADPELSGSLPSRSGAETAPWRALADWFDAHTARLDALLEPTVVPPSPPAPDRLGDLAAEAAEAGESAPTLAEGVARLLKQYQLPERALRPGDTASINSLDDRHRVRELADRIHALSGERKRRLPSLLHALAILEVAANEQEVAQQDFQAVTEMLREPKSLAAVYHNAYHTALERRDWAEALRFWKEAASLDPEQYAGFPLGVYLPERIVGVSGPGVLFLCVHQPTGRQVIVHALWPEGLELGVADVFRESRMLQQLDHPARVGLLDCAYADTGRRMPFLATDHFEGVSLAYYVRQHGPLAPTELAKIVKPVAEVVLAAHQRGVLHRAITPGSLFVRRDDAGWHAKLIDFGLSLSLAALHAPLTASPDWSRTRLGASVQATIPYVAPEQFGWVDGTTTGPGSDVYSFGKLCYFALLGTPEPDDEEKALLPVGWRKFLGACTARSLARRLPNFQAVLKQLTQTAAGEEPKTSGPAAPTPRTPAGLVLSSPSMHGVPKPPPLAPLEPATRPTPAVRPRLLTPSRQGVTRTPAASVEAGPEAESIAGLLNAGMTFKAQGDPVRALAAFDKAIQVDPRSPAAFIKRGNLHAETGQLDQAIADYSAALKVEPRNALAYMNRGLAHAKKGEFDAVLADCTEAISIDPRLAAAYFIRGAAYSSRGERHRAIAEFTLALRLDPNNALAYNDRGLAFAEQGEYDRALRDYTAALRIDSRLVLAYVNRGIAFRMKKQPGRAAEDLARALRVDPRNVQARFQRGLAMFELERFDDAVAEFTRVLQLDANHPEAAARREEARGALAKAGPKPTGSPAAPPTPAPRAAAPANRPTAAPARTRPVADGKPAPEKRPAAREPGRARPQIVPAAPAARPAAPVSPEAMARKRTDQAEEERRQMRAAAYFARGRTLFEQNDYEQAIEQFNKALEADPNDAVAFYHRGLAYEALQEFAEAIADFTDVLRLDARNAMAYYHRGTAHRLAGQHDRAISDTTRALRLDPRLAVAYHNRSLAYAAVGDRDRARADYEEAIRLDPALGKV
jgi:tetratricopeptide (TPR) repeat protein